MAPKTQKRKAKEICYELDDGKKVYKFCRPAEAPKTAKRRAPGEHAADLPENTVAESNRKEWVVKVMPNGIHRWVQNKAPLIHDNGGTPFRVCEEGSKIRVYKSAVSRENLPWHIFGTYTKLVLEIPKYKKLFIGKNTGPFKNEYDGEIPGSSVLVHVSGTTYISIGESIIQFEAPDGIEKFYSIMGNNDVPYPYAIGEKYTYLTLERVYTETANIPVDMDPYAHYYNMHRSKKSPWKPLKHKILVKRLAYGV